MHHFTSTRDEARNDGAFGDTGFTLIELLVVVVIISLLAAIAIPAFLSQREGAFLATAQADLKNASLAVENYALENGGGYQGIERVDLDQYGFNESPDIDVDVQQVSNTYTITAVSSAFSPTRTLTYSSVTGVVTG